MIFKGKYTIKERLFLNMPTPERTELTQREFSEAETTFAKNRAAASIPLSIVNGDPLLNLGRHFIEGKEHYRGHTQEITAAAAQSYAVSTADAQLYDDYKRPPLRVPPVVPSSHFVNLNGLSKGIDTVSPTQPLGLDGTLSTVERPLKIARKEAEDELYTPLFSNRDNPESQIAAGSRVRELIGEVEQAVSIARNGGISLKLKPEGHTIATVVNGITRVRLLPSSVPVNKDRGDFDSGNCDALLNTSLANGERVAVLASYGNHMLVQMPGREGWVHKSNLGIMTDEMARNLENDYDETFYVGGTPLFYDDALGGHKVLLPADRLYQQDGNYYIMNTDNTGSVTLQQLQDIDSSQFTSGVRTPQELINFLYGLQMPYMWAVFDCSEVMRRMFRLLGYSVRKYSGDMMDDLAIIGEKKIMKTSQDLESLRDGIYVADLSFPFKKDDGQIGYKSNHMFVITKSNATPNAIDAFSYAFNMHGDSSSTEYPVGPHVCSEIGLKRQFERNRIISAIMLAEL